MPATTNSVVSIKKVPRASTNTTSGSRAGAGAWPAVGCPGGVATDGSAVADGMEQLLRSRTRTGPGPCKPPLRGRGRARLWGYNLHPSQRCKAFYGLGVETPRTTRADIRDFLVSRRAKLTPEQLGLPAGSR